MIGDDGTVNRVLDMLTTLSRKEWTDYEDFITPFRMRHYTGILDDLIASDWVQQRVQDGRRQLRLREGVAAPPPPEFRLSPGPKVPSSLHRFIALQPTSIYLPAWATFGQCIPGRRQRAITGLLSVLAPCWDMGMAPTRDAVLSLAARKEEALMPIETAITPDEFRDALAALVHGGAVSERLDGRPHPPTTEMP